MIADKPDSLSESEAIPTGTEELDRDNLYTINRLGLLLGHDRRTVGKRLEGLEPDLVKGKRKYYSLSRVRDILEDKAKTSDEKQALEIKKLTAQIQHIEIKNNELLKKLVPQEEIARIWLSHIQKAKAQLLALEDLAGILAGLKVNQIKTKLHEHIMETIAILHECPVEEDNGSANKDN